MSKVTDVHLELTNHCNLACPVCPNRVMKRPKAFMPFSMVKHIIEANPAVRQVGLSVWGEPLLHPKFLSIVEYLCGKGLEVGFSTNATLLTEDLSWNLVKVGLHDINFSVDALGSEFERLRECSFELVKDNILYFLRLAVDVDITITVVAGSENESSIGETVDFWRQHAKVNVQPKVLFTRDKRVGKCYELYRNHLVVLSNGNIVPCCVDYEGFCILGHASTETLDECYNGEGMKLIREHGSCICDFCSEYETSKAKTRFKHYTLLQRIHVLTEAFQ